MDGTSGCLIDKNDTCLIEKSNHSTSIIILDENPLCVHCLDNDMVKPADVVDHIVPIKKGGAELDEANLQGLCHQCHNRKTYYENRQE